MKKKFSQIGSLATVAVLAVFLFSAEVNAHPGRTASDGCHYCRTNCAKWGEIQGARHCHGGYTEPVVETAPVIVEPSPSPIVVKTTPLPSPRLRPSPKPSPKSSTSPFSSPTSFPKRSPSPKVLGEEVDSKSTGGGGLGVAALLGYIFWRAIKQKWPFSQKIS